MKYTFSKKPLYNIEMVSNSKEIKKDQNIIKIPGFRDSALICAESRKIQEPTNSDDPAELLTSITGKSFTILKENDKLEICIDGESKFNGISLGFHAGFEHRNHSLFSFTEKGARCDESNLWTLTIEFQCDNTIQKSTLYIPAFWIENKCMVHALVKTSRLCRHIDFSDEHVINVKCISENDYQHSYIPDLY